MKNLCTVPSLSIELNGNKLNRSVLGSLEEVTLRHELSQPSLCELCFVSPTLDFPPDPGVQVCVTLGEEAMEVFNGEIAAVEYVRRPNGEQAVFVRAYDKLQSLRKRHSLRAYAQMTVVDLAREMTLGLGLTVAADEEGPRWRTLIPYNQSDFDFLSAVARRSGLFLTLRGSVLHLLALDGLAEQVELELGQTLFEATVEANGAFSCGSVTAAAWDPLRVEHYEGRAATPRSALEARSLTNHSRESATVLMANRTATDEKQAQALAQAELDLRHASSWAIAGTADGNASLLPGTRIHVAGYPAEFPEQYVLTIVTHRISRGTGFVSEISSRPAVHQPLPEGTVLAWGVVSDVKDPDQLGRVRLALPAVGDVETDWLEVLAVGAGKGKGFVSLPDVGDKVAALFTREDLSVGIVVGSLFGADGVDDYGLDEKIVRFALLTPGGNKIRFDDARKSIRLENASGSYVELSPDKVSLHSTADLEITAPGRKMTIAANSVNFRRQ
jgi:uncharacterized protein involved in type VI secretion and phage assembly